VTNIVEILVTAKNLSAPAFAEAKAGATGMESAMSKLNKTAALGAVAVVGFLGESVRMASKFDSEMALLNTQAGVSQDKIAGLSRGVLALSGKVAQDPDSLAESLFHVESNFESMGITSEKALHLTETAAKGATVGHANLVDVTNALTAAVASGIPGVQDFDQAMGVLNATVGVGDMKMQDLAAAFGGGMVATVKGFGLNIMDVGAALATFGDNNIRGAAAGTQLRMSVQALAKPVASGADALKRLGLTQSTLADDMQKGGLKLALEDLRDRMQKAGISADQQGQIITEAFGRKAGAGLNVLMSQMDRLESKYPALKAGANNFSAAWEATTHTFAFQMASLEEKLKVFGISVGEKVIPKIQELIGFIREHKDAALAAAAATGTLLAGMMAFSALSKINALFGTLATVVKFTGDVMVMTRVRILELQEASLAAGGGLKGLAVAFTTLGIEAKVAVAATGIGLALVVIGQLADLGKSAPPDIDRMTSALTKFGNSGVVTGELAKTLGKNLEGIGAAVDKVGGKLSVMEQVNKVLSFGQMQQKGIVDAKDKINAVDESLANLVKSGHADLAASAVKRFQDALAAQGKKPSEIAGDLSKYSGALDDLNLMNKLTADSMGAFGSQAVTTTAQLKAQELTAEGLKEAILDLNDTERGALDAQAGFEASIAAGTKALDDNGRALHFVSGKLDLTTEASRNEEGALSDLAAKTEAATEATLKSGGSQADAMAIYDQGRQKLIALAEAMGLSADDANNLADSILRIPDKTVTVTTDYVYNNGDQYGHHGGNYAHGGIIGGAATGGARGGMTWVGEHGPELVTLPVGSTVHSNPDSQRMAAGMGHGGEQSLKVEWVGGNAGDEFMSWLRKNIRIRGGNVQTVLGP
jgi:TP901 family phage tail tape measure protein